MRVEGREVTAGFSIWIALNGPGHSAAEEILREADKALYEAKAGGRRPQAEAVTPY
jgi:PleD family two-component response regulator